MTCQLPSPENHVPTADKTWEGPVERDDDFCFRSRCQFMSANERIIAIAERQLMRAGIRKFFLDMMDGAFKSISEQPLKPDKVFMSENDYEDILKWSKEP